MPKLVQKNLFLRGLKLFQQKKATSNSGFTLIEMLVSIAILLVIFSIVIFSLQTFGRQVEVESVSQNIMSTLRLARSQTLASEGDTVYGVHFESDKYVLFSGSSYVDGDSDNKEFDLTESELSSISLNGGASDVIFSRIRGNTTQFGTVTVSLIDDSSQARTININSTGQISLTETLSTTNTRLTDSRHLHFDLGWSIQNETTLTINFPNDSVTQNIAMAGYFNVGNTEFDWSGTITVGGVEQELRIHTHSLDAFDTVLSVHRDKRYNDKAVTISIDGQLIVSYTNTGTATIGPYGGVMTVQ